MIRLINRRLIIPRGDTGSFTIPVLTSSSAADISVFTIFDCLTRRKIFQKEIIAADNTLTVEFTHEDTVNLVPGKYVWDIKYYKNPTYAEGELIDGEEVDSYYAGFSLPICEIKETGDTLLLADDAPTSTMSPLQLNVINAAISEANTSKRDAAASASAAAFSANEASASAAAALQSQTNAEDAAGAAISAKDAAISASETAVSAQESAAAAESNAQDAASTATTKAEEASQSAADALSAKIDALAAVSEISNLQVQTTTLNPTSTATASYNSSTGILSLGIPRGHGVASIAKTATNGLIDTYTITFTNGNTTTFNITNGDSGVYYGTTAPTNPNVNVWIDPSGTNNLAAPTISISNIDDGKRLTITDINGSQTADILNGSPGHLALHICTQNEYNSETGIPTIQTPDQDTFYLVPGGSNEDLYVEWMYIDGNWEKFGSATIDLSNYVRKTDYATDSVGGVVKVGGGNSTGIKFNSNNVLQVYPATSDLIKSNSALGRPIIPSTQHESTFYGLAKAAGDTTQSQSSNSVGTYTDEAKTAIKTMLGVTDPTVTDVQVNGTSVVSSGVANVPIATNNTFGVVRTGNAFALNSNTLVLSLATESDIKGGANNIKALSANRQHAAAFYGLAKAAGADMSIYESATVGVYTEREISAIHEMLNAPVIWDPQDSVPTIAAMSGIQYICGECATLDITLPASGCIDVVFESGATPTVLTITPPTGVTVKWANGFDPDNLDADTTYEINIKDGLGVAVGWT